MEHDEYATLAAALRQDAENAHNALPQYRGHWDGWRISRITRRVRAHGTTYFEAGTLALVSPETRTEKVVPRGRPELPYDQWPTRTFAVAYSPAGRCNVAVRADRIAEVQDRPARA